MEVHKVLFQKSGFEGVEGIPDFISAHILLPSYMMFSFPKILKPVYRTITAVITCNIL